MKKDVGNFSAVHLWKRQVQVAAGKQIIWGQTTSNLRNHGNSPKENVKVRIERFENKYKYLKLQHWKDWASFEYWV